MTTNKIACAVFSHPSAEFKVLSPDQLIPRLFDSGKAFRVGWTSLDFVLLK